jgi:hypothetical protein
MSALPSLSGAAVAPALVPAPAKPRARGFLHIVRYGSGPSSVYVLTYHRLESAAPDTTDVGARHAVPVLHGGILPTLTNEGSEAKDPGLIDCPSAVVTDPEPRPKPVVAEGAQSLLNLLERLGVDFHLAEVRGALEDILRLGSANIPDLWLSDDDLLAKGLAES